MDELEVARLVSVFMPMTDSETRSFLFIKRREVRGFTNDFADALGIIRTSSYEVRVITQIQERFEQLRAGEPDLPDLPDEPDTGTCVGCGDQPLPDAEGLRWKKLNENGELTISVDHSGKPSSLAWLTNDVILANWAEPWNKGNNKIKFKMLTSGTGDVHIKWEPVDGPGNTLAFVWQPAGSAEFMASAGTLSGDMIIDNAERNYPTLLVHEVGKHEFGHSLGLGHGSQQVDVMYPTARGEFKELSTNDLAERNKRYPV